MESHETEVLEEHHTYIELTPTDIILKCYRILFAHYYHEIMEQVRPLGPGILYCPISCLESLVSFVPTHYVFLTPEEALDFMPEPLRLIEIDHATEFQVLLTVEETPKSLRRPLVTFVVDQHTECETGGKVPQFVNNPADLPQGKECFHCLQRPEKTRLCRNCKARRYCSEECQAADWPKHKEICDAARATTEKIYDELREPNENQ